VLLRRGLVAGAVVLCAAALLAMLALLRDETRTAFPLALVLAVAPVPAYVALVAWTDRFEPEPAHLLGLTFLWGAGVAVLVAFLVNTAATDLVAAELGAGAAEWYAGSVSAPLVEEALKGSVLLGLLAVRREEIDDALDGVVYAAMVGLGFAMSENVLYYGQAALAAGPAAAVELFVVRGLWAPFIHPLFTAATGLGVALAALRPGPVRLVAPLGGLAVAMALHAAWNTAARGGVLEELYLLLFLPLLGGLAALVSAARVRESRLIRRHLAPCVAAGLLAAEEVRALGSARRRRALRRAAGRRGGREARRATHAFERAATELAVLERRRERGQEPEVARRVELIAALGAARGELWPRIPPPEATAGRAA